MMQLLHHSGKLPKKSRLNMVELKLTVRRMRRMRQVPKKNLQSLKMHLPQSLKCSKRSKNSSRSKTERERNCFQRRSTRGSSRRTRGAKPKEKGIAFKGDPRAAAADGPGEQETDDRAGGTRQDRHTAQYRCPVPEGEHRTGEFRLHEGPEKVRRCGEGIHLRQAQPLWGE